MKGPSRWTPRTRGPIDAIGASRSAATSRRRDLPADAELVETVNGQDAEVPATAGAARGALVEADATVRGVLGEQRR